jgi:hypothetical protein
VRQHTLTQTLSRAHINTENIHIHSHIRKQIQDHASPLLNYVKIEKLPARQDRYVIDKKATDLIIPVLAHWASPAPESLILPVQLMNTISEIIATSTISSAQNTEISTHSDALRRLLSHDLKARAGGREALIGGDSREVTSSLRDLLRLMLRVAKQGFKGENGPHTTAPFPQTSPKLNLGEDIDTAELRMVRWCDIMRLASYFPHHPPFRLLQHCRYDLVNEQESRRRRAKNTEAENEVEKELKREFERKGFTCNKYKQKTSKLTAGVFTFFCMGCNVCVGFEMMFHSGVFLSTKRTNFLKNKTNLILSSPSPPLLSVPYIYSVVHTPAPTQSTHTQPNPTHTQTHTHTHTNRKIQETQLK